VETVAEERLDLSRQQDVIISENTGIQVVGRMA
jgi:hypothetical protein